MFQEQEINEPKPCSVVLQKLVPTPAQLKDFEMFRNRYAPASPDSAVVDRYMATIKTEPIAIDNESERSTPLAEPRYLSDVDPDADTDVDTDSGDDFVPDLPMNYYQRPVNRPVPNVNAVEREAHRWATQSTDVLFAELNTMTVASNHVSYLYFDFLNLKIPLYFFLFRCFGRAAKTSTQSINNGSKRNATTFL